MKQTKIFKLFAHFNFKEIFLQKKQTCKMTNNGAFIFLYLQNTEVVDKRRKKIKKCKVEFALNWRIFRLNFFKTDNRQDKNYGL